MSNSCPKLTLLVALAAASPTLSASALPFDDEFANASSLSSWTNRTSAEPGATAQYTTLDVNRSTAGRLTLIPTRSAWNTVYVGPFLYQGVTGNFVISARINARSQASATQAPTSIFSSAGVLARSPASAGLSSAQSWVMYNLGNQETFVGTEAESTINSTLDGVDRQPSGGVFAGVLRLCRVGDRFTTWHSFDGEQTWIAGRAFTRPDLPSTLQVGVVTNSVGPPNTLRAEFDFVRFAVPATDADCTRPMPAATTPQPPTVTWSSPASGASLITGVPVDLTAAAADADGSVVRVDFFQGSSLLGSVTQAPYRLSWVAGAPGPYAFTAVATDDTGRSATSSVLSVSVVAVPPPVAVLGDEFSDPASLSRWSVANPGKVQSVDIQASTANRLTLVPIAVAQSAWYSDEMGPLLYQLVTGDFVVEVDVNAGRVGAPALAPRGQFGGAGIIVRDPASASPGGQSLVMYDVGYQLNSVAREAKTTRAAPGASLSTLFLNATPAGEHAVKLRVCRLGSTFRFFHRHSNEASWVEEAYTPTTQRGGNGATQSTPGINASTSGTPIQFIRTDLPATVQVGLMAGNWQAPLEVRADFDYARFGGVSSPADCTAPLPPAP